MPILTPTPGLSSTLKADATLCAAVGLLQAFLPGFLARLTGLDRPLILGTGLFLLAFAAFLGGVARRGQIPMALVGFVVLGNLGWVLGCATLAWVRPLPPLGLAYLGVQASATTAFALLEAIGLRRSRTLASPLG